MAYDIEFHPEWISEDVFIAANATVLGQVHIGSESSVWFNAVIRGDTAKISLGRQTNIQDQCVLHADEGVECTLGDRVTVGHAAIVHGATIADDVMIGMRAVVLNHAEIGSGSIIAAGAIVPEGTKVPANSLVMGVPGKVVRECSTSEHQRIEHAAAHYVEAGKIYRAHVS